MKKQFATLKKSTKLKKQKQPAKNVFLRKKTQIHKLTKINSRKIILEDKLVSLTGATPDVKQYIIELFGVKKSYFSGVETKALDNVDFKIKHGDFLAIVGPSGSGKTTLLNIVSGLDKVNEGDVFVLGKNLTLLKENHLTLFRRDFVGFIFQQYNLLSNLTAWENVEIGAHLCSKKRRDQISIKEIFDLIGMADQTKKYPWEMSGGQQQRVAIARALAKAPLILFADEPTGALDEAMGRRVLSLMKKINEKYQTTFIIVTHDLEIASICNTIVHVKNGKIEKYETNAHPQTPEDITWQ